MNQENNNTGRREVKIDLVEANKISLGIMAVAVLLYGVPYFMIWQEQLVLETIVPPSGLRFFMYAVIFIAGAAVHELIHGITFACYAKRGFHAVSYGIIWKMLTPYAHCDEPLRSRQYVVAALMPCVLLGIVPAVVSLCIGSFPMLVFGILFTAAAAGDLIMSRLVLKEDKDSFILDHPSEAGFYVLDSPEV